ncbi:hypothetical protein BDW42DRAFT_190906 [Aspergillus taichungensis]|uniref:Uncharacterized protein n=1 Tax=Aspergillus taichungensis TaxID=482145 RepID=A0A2J5I5W0_9EURO|nr:hypothetical protein BDW42DRAFT_190906 [Aspergillus taichungensis]
MQYKFLCVLISIVASAVAEPDSGDDAYSAAMASLESNTDLAKMATATDF